VVTAKLASVRAEVNLIEAPPIVRKGESAFTVKKAGSVGLLKLTPEM
jgi:hypothetical protein